MRISDWSSDVCSSDLTEAARVRGEIYLRGLRVASVVEQVVEARAAGGALQAVDAAEAAVVQHHHQQLEPEHHRRRQIGGHHQVAAVADHHHPFTLRLGHLPAQATGEPVATDRKSVVKGKRVYARVTL